ncbi:glycosyltransferase [Aliarcobacter cryaerophilus]|uniref:glycosyltransferase family 2 protein n=1 Tax=Aliarcobacter cryaerophilus TaxID=28198 RepID=UPI0021B609E8|nr:glycosyltransferase family 2 protein [Aliarcobacter cryaerophilus]MCT7489216.1 glycosyltransferase [Aliarcobacter cryaerophilus]
MKNSMQPLVTIAIPTYNRPNELKKAIESAINQTYENLEIFISDNCSTDEKVEQLCNEYLNKDKRIRYVRQIENKGPLFNYNYLLENANGKYHIYLADDDWLSENYISECINILENSDYSIVFGNMKFYKTDYSFIRACPQVSFDENCEVKRIEKYCKTAIQSCLSYGLVRTELVKNTIQNTKPRLPEDWIYMIKILHFGKGKYLDTISYNALNNGASKNIEGLQKFFDLPHLNEKNFWSLMAENIVESILYDEFYQTRLEKNERISLALKINNALMQNDIKPTFFTRLKNRLRRIYGK